MTHPGLMVVGTLAILAVIPALAIQYRDFLDRAGQRSVIGLTVLISAGSLGAWLVISSFIPSVWRSPLEPPTAALAAVAGFLASLTIRDTTSRSLPAVVFSIGWTTLVFAPIAIIVLFPTSVGIPLTAGPLDLGGALPVQVAVGACALTVLTAGRRGAATDRAHARQGWGLWLLSGLVIWAGWLLGFVGLELTIDSVITPRIIENSLIAPVFGIIGWLVAQRIVNRTTTANAAVAGMLSGIVAISAGVAYFTPLWSGITGSVAGLAGALFVYGRIRRTGRHAWFLVGAHLVAASIGLLMVGIFGLGLGLIYTGQTTLFEVQFVSIIAVVLWSGLVSSVLWIGVRRSTRHGSPGALRLREPGTTGVEHRPGASERP
jgi:Amt family ammonium transporter